MPKLYFRYGTMNSSKTANLLMVAWNYRLQCRKVLLVKPIFDESELTERAANKFEDNLQGEKTRIQCKSNDKISLYGLDKYTVIDRFDYPADLQYLKAKKLKKILVKYMDPSMPFYLK